MLYAFAEIVTLDGVVDSAANRDEIAAKLDAAWRWTGTWAAAIIAGNADEPMRTICVIDAGGELHWHDDNESARAQWPEALAEATMAQS